MAKAAAEVIATGRSIHLPILSEAVCSAAVLSIVVHDHIIIGKGRFLSFRQEGLL